MEPAEAELFPGELSREQDERFRMEGAENAADVALGRAITRSHSSQRTAVNDEAFVSDKYNLVTFEHGKGEDPREFGAGKKWAVTGCTSSLCLAVALGSSIVTGDLEGPVATLHTSQEIVNLTVALFVVGFGLGPLIFAPLSEVVGRKPIYSVSMFGYFIFTLPSALSKNAATLVVARLIAGIFASAPMCNVGGSISDVWAIEDRGIPMALFSGTIFLGPCLGPILGGWIGEKAGWRWIYWVLFALTGATFIGTLLIPETLAPVLLKRKADRLRKETGDSTLKTQAEIDHIPVSERLKIALIRPFILMFCEPIVLFMSIFLTFVYSLLYLFFFAYPLSFAEVRGFGLGITGTTFVSIMIGLIIALCLMPLQEKKYKKVTADGAFPEARLYPMMVGAIILPIALFIYAFTGFYPWVHWIAPCIAGAIFGFSLILIYVAANSYIVDSYSNYAASAVAAKTLLRSEVAAAVPLFVTQMFHGMGEQYAGLFLALISCCILPIPFFFYFRGEKIRLGSKRASKATRGSGAVAVDIAH
ncbi:MFS polyamine transporter [Pseudohyphozyma bogoriensis]|nr:MFS polyamine transporter [Pseudohyphozyma bogoriensis]